MPVWLETIDVSEVWRNDDMSFKETRDAVVARVQQSQWYKHSDPNEWSGLYRVIEEIAVAQDVQEFDGWWNDLYDIADRDRVWIKTYF